MNYLDIIFQNAGSALEMLSEWKTSGYKVVFTNGCFDLLHRGHIKYLEEASRLGDKLVIGLNSDESVSRIKGNNRPVKDQKNRAEILAALKMVDMVIIFDEDTPDKLIRSVIPDVLVKGGDWSVDQIVGADFVLNNGGKVRTLSFIEGESSSAIISKILKNN